MAIAEWINTLEFTAVSPDGTVRARLTGRSPAEVKLCPADWRRHSETSLAQQVEAATREVMLAWQKAVDERRYGGRDPVRLAGAGDEFATRQLEFHAAAGQVSAVGTSTFRHVKIGWRGVADLQVRIEADTIAKLDREQLTAEINSGIAAVVRSRGRQVLRLSEQYYPVPIPPSKGGSRER